MFRCTSTDDALDKFKSNIYDLIITDMKRQNDDLAGYTLLREKIKLGNKDATNYIHRIFNS